MDAHRPTEQPRDGEVMEKTVLVKEDGRRLISYRFRPAHTAPDIDSADTPDNEGEPRE